MTYHMLENRISDFEIFYCKVIQQNKVNSYYQNNSVYASLIISVFIRKMARCANCVD